MRRPEVTLSIVVVALGLWAVITGVLYCVLAFEVRHVARAVTAGATAAGSVTSATAATSTAGGAGAGPDVAAPGAAAGDIGPALERIDRLYAEGHLSEADHARLTDALRSPSPGLAVPPRSA
jgi:hypothetical protein